MFQPFEIENLPPEKNELEKNKVAFLLRKNYFRGQIALERQRPC